MDASKSTHTMKGFLKLAVLHELSEGERTGYDLMSNIGDNFGKKPSPGSMYPLLNDLHNARLIRSKLAGRRKIYSLTDRGKTSVKKLCKTKQMLMEKHIELFTDIIGPEAKEHIRRMTEILDKLKTKNKPLLAKTVKNFIDFRETLLELGLDPQAEQKADQISTIIQRATKDLKQLRRKNINSSYAKKR